MDSLNRCSKFFNSEAMGALMSAKVFRIMDKEKAVSLFDFGLQVKQICWCWLALFAFLFFSACAQIVPPSGGPKDVQPPQLDSLLSTPNYSTNFEKQDIVLVFDEFVKLYDPYTQVVVSPPLNKRPQIEVEKYRRLRFRFDEEEVLHPNTTYTIYFGRSIQDFTEGNAVDLRFVFSTGQQIDSLSAEGKLVDARTGEAIQDALVLLYEARSWRDSVVVDSLPLYFARTDAQGRYLFENLRADSFRLFALEDANANYRFDQSSERIAFLDEVVVVGRDSTGREHWPDLRMFEQEQPLRLLDVQAPHYGFLSLLMNRPPINLEIRASPEQGTIYRKVEQDSLLIWYHRADTSVWSLLLEAEGSVDTVELKPEGRASFLAGRSVGFRQMASAAPTSAPQRTKAAKEGGKITASPRVLWGKQLPGIALELEFDAPLQGVDSAFFRWEKDSLPLFKQPQLMVDSTDARRLLILHDWQPGSTYNLVLLPGGLKDIYGATNDTMYWAWEILPKEEISSLALEVVFPDTTQKYVVRLLKGEKVVWELATGGLTPLRWYFPALYPGTYHLQLIEDTNGNGHWDTGHFWRHRQPERFFEHTLETLRPNWEVQAEVRF